MEKSIIINKIKRKLNIYQSHKLQTLIDENLRTYIFIYKLIKVSDRNNTIQQNHEKYLKLIKLLKKWKYFPEQKKFYKSSLCILNSLLQNINIYNLLPCQNRFLREHQLKTVHFCKKLCDVFTENNLQYFITSGTLIGYLRHSGFIPWDDDMDIGMMREDYEKLKLLLKERFVEIDISKIMENKENKLSVFDKYLHKYHNQILFSITHHHIQIMQGTSIKNCLCFDIFPHDFYSETYTVDNIKKDINDIRKNCNSILNFKEKYQYILDKIANNNNITQTSNKIFFGFDSLDSYLFPINQFMTKNTIFPLRKILFENMEFFAPNNMEEYISNQYKNWNQLPNDIKIAPELSKRCKGITKQIL